jgi:3-hydroxy-3-methylglutaryl CoA synthase
VDEDDFSEEQRKRVRDLLCATAESLALATKSELEIEAKLKSEESTPLETAVAADLQQATVQEPGEATNGAGAVSV